jgi:uncharacterized protein (TIGR01777 family)
MDKRVLIFGGTGFIGLSLARHLAAKGFEPVLIARNAVREGKDFPFLAWDAVTVGPWADALEGAAAIVNLAGKSVDCVKTPENRELILRSRVDSTLAIGQALRQVKNPPKVWVQMSTAHIYGDPEELRTESSPIGTEGLAPMVGKAWEEAFLQSLPAQMRGARLRTSFVIGRQGGALASLQRIARLGLGGKTGKGSQGISWLHEDDMNDLIHQCIVNDAYRDFYIATAPHPVSNREFMRTLRKVMRVPIGLPAPAFMVRLGSSLVFKTDPELVLLGRYVKSERLEQMGFKFQFPTLELALRNLIA